MIKKILLFCLLVIGVYTLTFAQNTYNITGTIKDKQGILPGAAVYVSGYKLTAVADEHGKFILPKMAPGNYDILIQMIGYISLKQNIILVDKSVDVNVVLNENTTLLNEIVVKPDPDRAYHISLFKDYFIGKSPNAEECKLLNSQVLATHFDKKTSVLNVSASEFLVVENKALGYRIKYSLEYFEYNFKTRVIYYAGLPFFEELKGGSAKQKKWAKARTIAYNGSIQHFFKSLYQNKLAEEGFVVNKLIKIPNPMRKSDSLINANIKRLTAAQMGANKVIAFNGSDSLSYWFKQRNEPKVVNTINRGEVKADTLLKIYNQDLKKMNYTDALYVIYKNETETEAYRNSGHWQSRPLDMPNYQISVIHLLQAPTLVYANGGIFDPKSLLYEGYMAYEKVADLMPMDYKNTVAVPQKK